MVMKALLRPVNLFILILTAFSGYSHQETIEINWKEKELQSGVILKTFHGRLFQSEQSINVLKVDMERIEPKILYTDPELITTSDHARNAGAIAAVNGTFFNVKNGGAVCYMRVDAKVVNPSKPGPDEREFFKQLDEGALAVNESGRASVIRRPAKGWVGFEAFPSIISSGPMLIFNSRLVQQNDNLFNQTRHPRTGTCTDPEGKLLLITIDGRTSEAEGVTTYEFSQIMQVLSCENGINFDGGGSTTMWSLTLGILNYPSDNEAFDREGEREVANAIGLFPRDGKDTEK